MLPPTPSPAAVAGSRAVITEHSCGDMTAQMSLRGSFDLVAVAECWFDLDSRGYLQARPLAADCLPSWS